MKYAYWLSNIPKITSAKIRLLRNEVQSAEELYGLSEQELHKIQGINSKLVCAIMESKNHWNLEKEWFDLIGKGIGMVSLEQEHYPNRLRNIHNPPYVLYYIGELPKEEEKSVAIVGARGRSAYPKDSPYSSCVTAGSSSRLTLRMVACRRQRSTLSAS